MAIPRILMQVSLWLIWKIVLTNTMGLAAKSLPDCPDSCGDLVVPYPFGTTENCSLGTRFLIKCSKSDPIPTPFLGNGNLMVTNISLDGEVEILNFVAKDCYKYGQQRNPNKPKLWLSPPYSISNTKNKFFAVGCDTYATIDGYRDNNRYTTGCISSCQQGDMQSLSESCSGVGCCEISIPKGLKNITLNLSSFYNHKYVSSFNPCSFAFLVQKDTFKFNNTIISSGKLDNVTSLPMILNWSIGNVTCEVARTVKNYSCKANSKCVDSSSGSGYICQCFDGYEGNPYHPDGCQDIDECTKTINPCINGTCNNTPGSFDCFCEEGYSLTNRTFCSKVNTTIMSSEPNKALFLYIPLSVSIGVVALVATSLMIFWGVKKRKSIELKQKFFEKNGGIMLLQQLSSHRGSLDKTKIFTIEALKKATKNFHKSRILGEGGYGTVYKGVLTDNKLVAIKRSKVGDQAQTEQFINELIVLMQINNDDNCNVVKLFGCCLETEVPLLVYEFITNGTLSERIHNKNKEVPPLSWEMRLKIATETAGALAYLHYDTSIQIIHRDVKTANILLDENNRAKVSDFGASRLNPLDQYKLKTKFVVGTCGYLDPEYMQSCQLTHKSDVYSFGVVLAELLTGMKAFSFSRPEKDRFLANCFVSALEEDRLLDIFDVDIVNDRNVKALKEVANLAGKCLRVKGEERPGMKEVAMELQGLRIMEERRKIETDNLLPEETKYLLGSPLNNPYCSMEIVGGESSNSNSQNDKLV